MGSIRALSQALRAGAAVSSMHSQPLMVPPSDAIRLALPGSRGSIPASSASRPYSMGEGHLSILGRALLNVGVTGVALMSETC